MQIQIYRDEAGETRYRKRSENGEIFGDGYRDEADARRGLVSEVVGILQVFGPAVTVGGAFGREPGERMAVDVDLVERIVREITQG